MTGELGALPGVLELVLREEVVAFELLPGGELPESAAEAILLQPVGVLGERPELLLWDRDASRDLVWRRLVIGSRSRPGIAASLCPSCGSLEQAAALTSGRPLSLALPLLLLMQPLGGFLGVAVVVQLRQAASVCRLHTESLAITEKGD